MVKTSHIFSATIFYFRVDIYMPATHLLQILIAGQQCKKGNTKAKKKKKGALRKPLRSHLIKNAN